MIRRNSGIDLLKIISMFGIVFMHVLVKGGILDFGNTTLSVNSFYWVFECIFMCSVDCFGLISGYLSTSNELNISKLIKLWFQVVFYSLIIDLVLCMFGLINDYSIVSFLSDVTPVISGLYWYFNAYIPMYLLKEYFKDAIDHLSINSMKTLFVLLIAIYCVVGLMFDPFDVGYGYTSLWIILLYIFGYLAKQLKLFENLSTLKLVLISILCVVINWTLNTLVTGVILNYNSPTVLLSAFCLLIIFSRIDIKNKFITSISILTFGVYLFHENSHISKLLVSDKLLAISNLNPILVILCVFLYALFIFVLGLIIDYIRKYLFKLIKIDSLCISIAKIIDKLLESTKKVIFTK